jgi:hypothetical protein
MQIGTLHVEVPQMPLDQDVNQAIFRLHIGTTLPFWEHAVRLQVARLGPIQDWVVQRLAAAKRCQAPVGTAEDTIAMKELADLVEKRLQTGEGPFAYSSQNRIDSIFLLLAIRSILTMADRIVKQLEPLHKDSEAAQARNTFVSRFPVIKDLRDVTIHYDEYALGQGRRRDLIVDPNEGLGVTEDEDGYLQIMWAGHRLNLLEAADGARTLARELTQMFWGALTA